MSAVLGLGTLMVRDVGEAARAACAAAVPPVWIDTAPGYADGWAHEVLAPVLADHPAVKIATKTGLYGTSQRAAATHALWWGRPRSRHDLSPRFVRWQTEQSLRALGRVDMVFVEYPERAYGPYRRAVHAQLREAFGVLEEFAQAGRIGG
ncbi:aldo/keto reductase [Streptomyces olivoreticuli]